MPDWKSKIVDYGTKAVKVASEAAEVVVLAKGAPGVIGGTAIAARVVSALHDLTEKAPIDYFRGSAWTYHTVCFPRLLLNLAKQRSLVAEVKTSYERGCGRIWTGDIYGEEFGWIEHDEYVNGPWIRNADSSQAQATLGRLVWETLGPAVKLEATATGTTLLPDLLTDALPSVTGDEVYAKLNRFNEAGHTRSALLIGPPGTGKSHLMRYVSRLGGGFSMRIRVASLSNLRDIPQAIALLKPSAVLIDDLDRAEHPERILSEIEEIKHSARLFICSVNDLSGLDPAVLRVGRFDEKITLQHLDEGVLSRLIGDDVPKAIEKKLRDLPVAWVHEFHICRSVLGDEAAFEKVKEMIARHEEIKAMMHGEDTSNKEEPCPG